MGSEKVVKDIYPWEWTEERYLNEQEVWVRVVVAYTGAINSVNVDRAIQWADKVVEAYKERYAKS